MMLTSALRSQPHGAAMARRLLATASTTTPADRLRTRYDAIVVGGGHNGLIASAYLAEQGLDVLVLERRHIVGGAAVTEEIVPGFKFSRASYLLSLLRPTIVNHLDLERHGLKTHIRNTSSFTPTRDGSNYLLMGRDADQTQREIAKFSKRDAEVYADYEGMLEKFVRGLDLLLDDIPFDASNPPSWRSLAGIKEYAKLARIGGHFMSEFPRFAEILTAPAAKVLDNWFESKLLKATLATDAVIGAMTSPYMPGSGYVLLHHVMGEIQGIRGAWAYAEGGMGAVSTAIARAAVERSVHIAVDSPVKRIIIKDKKATGVELIDGTKLEAPIILSNATPQTTFIDLVGPDNLDADFLRSVQSINYQAATMKINVAINELPNFNAIPNVQGSTSPQPHHQATTHFEESMEEIHKAYLDATAGKPSERPMIEMCVPSTLDKTISPPGKHVVSLFVQYAPYHLKGDSWENPSLKEKLADKVFSIIDHYAPNFSSSVIGRDVLSPLDLEQIFGLTGGNIFHGSMSLDQLYFMRPTRSAGRYATPVHGLYLCGSGAHPGGGVMGAAGRNAAMRVLGDHNAARQRSSTDH